MDTMEGATEVPTSPESGGDDALSGRDVLARLRTTTPSRTDAVQLLLAARPSVANGRPARQLGSRIVTANVESSRHSPE